MKVAMHKVDSSSIASIGHDGRAMHVEFKNGSTYRYESATHKHFTALKDADSVGEHFAKHVRGTHEGVKVK